MIIVLMNIGGKVEATEAARLLANKIKQYAKPATKRLTTIVAVFAKSSIREQPSL